MGLIACHYRAAEWRHKEIELAAHELLQRFRRNHRLMPVFPGPYPCLWMREDHSGPGRAGVRGQGYHAYVMAGA
jgi:hypothetical protein